MDNSCYARLYDSWVEGNRTEVAAELLTLPESDAAEFAQCLTSDRNVFEAGALVRLMRRLESKRSMRLFKVYDLDESSHELVFAKNHRQAAAIIRDVWQENGYDCGDFRVIELCLPSIKGREPLGLVYEPATAPKEIRFRKVQPRSVTTA